LTYVLFEHDTLDVYSLFYNCISNAASLQGFLVIFSDFFGRYPGLIRLNMKIAFFHNFPGQSLVPLIKGGQVSQDHVYIEWNPNSGALKEKKGGTSLASREELKRIENEHSRAVISPDGWKLCLSDADKCQLFNLKKDSGETINLFDSGLHRDVILRQP